HDAIERHRRPILRRVTFNQLDIVPVIAFTKRARLREHSGGKVYAVDAATRPDCRAQEGKISARPAADLEHVIASSQTEAIDSLGPESGRLEEQPVEQGNEAGQAVIAPRDEAAVKIDPLMRSTSCKCLASLMQQKLCPPTRGDPGISHHATTLNINTLLMFTVFFC